MQAKTHMCAAAERHPGILVARANRSVCKAQGVETEGVRPDFGHAMGEDGIDGNTRTGGKIVAFETKLAHSAPRHRNHRWIDAHGLLEGHFKQDKLTQPL